MASSIVKTKLFLPTARSRLIDRPRLMAQLDSATQDGCRAVLVSAPAGSGKTTVVVQWLRKLGWPLAWISLDERDNLPKRFLSYLIAALQAVAPGAGLQAGALLDLPAPNLEEVIALLVNDLAEHSAPFLLALDDCHLITNPNLLQALDYLLEVQPAQMRLLLLSREDPALPLARRRASGQLVELRQEDLRFSSQEAAAFLNQGMQLGLSGEQVEALAARTEGWIAGLQMAALSLRHQPDPQAFIRNFSGSHRFILEYLMEEVLARQPSAIQDFLLQTAILEQLCAPLCAVVMAEPTSTHLPGVEPVADFAIQPDAIARAQQMLDRLVHANLFVIPLDNERTWFRYHHLFGDLLQARLQVERPGQSARLHQRAAGWYAANGDPRAAVEHALKGDQLEYAADLLEQNIASRWRIADLEFMELVNRLPRAVIEERPALCLQNAWICVLYGQTNRILPLVEAAERGLDQMMDARDPYVSENRAFAKALRAYLNDIANQPVILDNDLDQAYELIPEVNTGMRNSVAVMLGTIHFMENDFAGAERFYMDALQRDKRASGTNAVPIATSRLVRIRQVQGRLRDALQLLMESEAYVRARNSRLFYIAGILNLQWGEILLEWNRLEEAEAQIRAGLRLLKDWPSLVVNALGLSLLIRVQVARGEQADARDTLDRLDTLTQKGHMHVDFRNAVERARLRLWVAEENRTELENWASANALGLAPDFSFRTEPHHIFLSRAWLALGRRSEACALLQRLAEEARTEGRDGSRVEILALLAAAYGNQLGPACAALTSALRLAEPEGYTRLFLDLGQPMHHLLSTWLSRTSTQLSGALETACAQRLLAAFEEKETGRLVSPAVEPGGLVEPLSARELEVLALAAQGLTNQQIAARLVISIRTVKKHIENINGKLGAQNRTQAAARARELGILSQSS